MKNSDQETIFSKIIRKEIAADIVYESEMVLAFKDINPKAPHHILVIPKKFYKDILDVDPSTVAELFIAVQSIAKDFSLDEQGFRVVINTGSNGGQTVFHLHIHIMGGRPFTWPPG
jgi:histidine triad (HIT) family protein